MARIVALGLALALSLLLLAARSTEAAKYSVAQCGWHIGADASWSDSTGGAKFRSGSYCVPPASSDPFDSVHMKSFTKEAATVSGTRFARWRWEAPPGTAISRVTGTWWQALHDGMEQRLGVGTWSGGFTPFATATATNVGPRSFVAGVSPAQPALESRLLCARAEAKFCSLENLSWSSVRALTIVIEDNGGPGAGVGGEVAAGGWRRGNQGVAFSATDIGAGVRFGETLVDGSRVALTEYPCAKALISGEWRATRMRPCELAVSGSAAVATTNLSDGPHSLGHCATDFAGNVGCAPPSTFLVDNNAPAHPRALTVAGGEEWRRVNDFDLSWTNPEQGRASPIAGAGLRVDGKSSFVGGRGLTALRDIRVAGAGVHPVAVWLRDEAGNEDPGSVATATLRFDDVRPGVAFAPVSEGLPEVIEVAAFDAHSGPARGSILLRRLGSESWVELATKIEAGRESGSARLSARLPADLEPGVYGFRADVVDGAGNLASSSRRIDGTEMAVRKLAPVAAPKGSPAPGVRTRLFAHLRWRKRGGASVTVPFGARARVAGRLVDVDGAGLGNRVLRVVSRPSRGAHAKRRVQRVRTGRRGGFKVDLVPGTSRRVTVSFAGEGGFDGSRRPALALRVRGGAELHAAPRSLRTGQSVRLWGRVRSRGAPIPRRGKLIAIQYFESAASSWRPVLVTRTDHSGRFRTNYLFRYVSGAARVRMRAMVLPEERWPYVPGHSRPVVVRVN